MSNVKVGIPGFRVVEVPHEEGIKASVEQGTGCVSRAYDFSTPWYHQSNCPPLTKKDLRWPDVDTSTEEGSRHWELQQERFVFLKMIENDMLEYPRTWQLIGDHVDTFRNDIRRLSLLEEDCPDRTVVLERNARRIMRFISPSSNAEDSGTRFQLHFLDNEK